jgi:hypothetical protein
MTAIVRDITIEIGSVWDSPLVLMANGQPYDLTGAQARMHIRDMDGNLLIELSTENGCLLIDAIRGRLDRRLLATASQGVTVEKGLYDMEIIPGGDATLAWKLYRGRVKFIPEQTRE